MNLKICVRVEIAAWVENIFFQMKKLDKIFVFPLFDFIKEATIANSVTRQISY